MANGRMEEGGKSRETTATFAGRGGVEIFYRMWPAEEERARVVVAHGLGEHSGRYRHVAAELVSMGLTVFALDHRGHGKSGGRRGHIASFDDYLEDVRTAVHLARDRVPESEKCFLLGHSMGGLIALAFALRLRGAVDGVIASSPALGAAERIPPVKAFAGKVLSRFWPTFSFDNELDAAKISHDPATVKAYQEDPLVHRTVTARWFTEFMGAMKSTVWLAPTLKTPALMQVAGDDKLVNPRAAEAFFKNLGAEDKTLRMYEGLFHEVYNETEVRRAGVLSDLKSWLQERV